MGNRIAISLVLLAAITGGYFVYRHRQEEKMDVGGEVTCQGCMTPEEKARFDKEDRGDTADGQSERKARTARADDAAGFPDAKAGAATPAAAAGVPAAAAALSANTPASVLGTQSAAAKISAPAGDAGGSTNVPVTDTLTPNAPSGMAFGGKGTYQWYRQGNLTWRLDTVSGRSCIVYATLEEWRKQIVMSHGCGREA